MFNCEIASLRSQRHHNDFFNSLLIDEAIYDIGCAVRNLLDYAKRHEPKLEDVDVDSLLRRTIVMADYKLQKMGIAVETYFEADLPHARGDPHQLQEVFLIL